MRYATEWIDINLGIDFQVNDGLCINRDCLYCIIEEVCTVQNIYYYFHCNIKINVEAEHKKYRMNGGRKKRKKKFQQSQTNKNKKKLYKKTFKKIINNNNNI